MRNEKGDITIKSVWKWLRSDSGKKYSFAVFYLVFFIFIFILISLPSPNDTKNENNYQKEENTFPYSIKEIENNSYKFKYILKINDNLNEYLVNKNNNKLIINDDTGIYNYSYQDGKLVYNGDLEPISYSNFLNFYEVKRILKKSKLISETKLTETEEYLYTYSLKTSDLIEILDIESLNFSEFDLENQIVVKANKKNELETITFDIINFIKTVEDIDLEINLSSYEVILDYGEIYE